MSLPQSVQDQIADWLTVANQSYEQVRQRCAQELGVTTSVGALQHFYGVYAAPRKYAQAADAADAFASLMQGRFDEATIKKAQELAFDAINSPAPDVKTAKTLVKIVGDSANLELKRRKLAIDERKVALLEKKAAQADAAQGVLADVSLTPEQREQRYKEIFGIRE